MRKQKVNAIAATKVALANEANEVAATLANEVAEIATPTEKAEETKEAAKAEKAAPLTEKEKTAIKAVKASQIATGCEIPASFTVAYLKEGFTVYVANAAGEVFKKKGICGIDKLSTKADSTAQFFFYKNPLSSAALLEIFGEEKAIPAMQKFSTGGSNFNTFIRCDVAKLPALVAASLATSFTTSLVSEMQEEERKATEKAEKTAKAATTTEVGEAA